jgi:hypothetical protein
VQKRKWFNKSGSRFNSREKWFNKKKRRFNHPTRYACRKGIGSINLEVGSILEKSGSIKRKEGSVTPLGMRAE